jgi:hypothetical protein
MAQPNENGTVFTARTSNKRPAVLLGALALGLHFTTVAAMSLLGSLAIFPNMIDSNGVGISFAIDSVWNRYDAVVLAQILWRRGVVDWLLYPAPFHAKLYSLSFALFDPWSDFSVLGAEPANALLYLLILVLVFKIGAEVCDRRTGTLAAGIVALWPSFFLHTTQFLREPQFIAAILALTLVAVRWLTRSYSLHRALALAAVGAFALAFIWLIRAEMWEVVIAIVLIGAGLLILRQLRGRQILEGNLLGVVLLMILIAIIPRVLPRFLSARVQSRTLVEPAEAQPGAIGLQLPARIRLIRGRYVGAYKMAGSNVDNNLGFASTGDIVRYLPRAAAIGLFAPFPDMWFVRGVEVGRVGRLLSGLETAVIYVIEVLAIIGLWQRRRQLSAWLLMMVCIISSTALGLVVANISIIYRLRYAFFMMIIVLGADGGLLILSALASKRPMSAAVVT